MRPLRFLAHWAIRVIRDLFEPRPWWYSLIDLIFVVGFGQLFLSSKGGWVSLHIAAAVLLVGAVFQTLAQVLGNLRWEWRIRRRAIRIRNLAQQCH